MATTKLADLINPEVMAPIISAKIENAVVATPFAKIDNTLEGRAGNTITVPQYDYIGDAEDVAEGEDIGDTKLTANDVEYTVKKAAKGVTLTDEAILSGYGNPVGEAGAQLGKAIASKIDADCIAALLTSTHQYTAEGQISYAGIVDAIDLFDEELNTEKVMFVNPKQVSTLRKDANFISADKYPGNVIMTGEIGKIANTRIVASRRIVLDERTGLYACPIVKLEADERTEDETPALTIYKKREVNVESERDTHTKTTYLSADQHYTAALTNAAKVVVAFFLGNVTPPGPTPTPTRDIDVSIQTVGSGATLNISDTPDEKYDPEVVFLGTMTGELSIDIADPAQSVYTLNLIAEASETITSAKISYNGATTPLTPAPDGRTYEVGIESESYVEDNTTIEFKTAEQTVLIALDVTFEHA